jgi:hypothetical protein
MPFGGTKKILVNKILSAAEFLEKAFDIHNKSGARTILK